MKKSIFKSTAMLLTMLICAFAASAQSAVKWTAFAKMTSKTEGVVTIEGSIEKGWHLYGFNLPEDGPVSTTVSFTTPKNFKFLEPLRLSPKPITKQDDMFGMEVTYWENKVKFTRKFKLDKKSGATEISCTISYMACNDSNCQPPTSETLTIKVK